MMKPAFIIGNGTSRSPIDLNCLKDKGTIFGCNALYRDFSDYDFLVAIDDDIIIEVFEEARDDRLIIPKEHDRWESRDYSNNRRRSNAGMNAMQEAIRREHNKLYCMGFDFILKGEESTSNLYANTNCYGTETHTNIEDNKYRVRYLKWFTQDNKDVSFTFVLPRDIQHESISGANITGIYVDKFIDKFG